MATAIGLLEVYGTTCAFVAADAACKAANVKIEAIDNNKPANADALPVPLIVLIKFSGSVDDVREAVEAGATAANRLTGVVTKHIITRAEDDTQKLIKINCLAR